MNTIASLTSAPTDWEAEARAKVAETRRRYNRIIFRTPEPTAEMIEQGENKGAACLARWMEENPEALAEVRAKASDARRRYNRILGLELLEC